MEAFSALLALCVGNSPVSGEFPSQKPVTRTFHVFFYLRLSKQLSKQPIRRWFDTPSHSLWRHCNVIWSFVLFWPLFPSLTSTHWGRLTHICVSKLTIIGSDNGLSPGRCQAIVWTNAGILLIGPLGTNFSEILVEFHTFSFKKIHLKM